MLLFKKKRKRNGWAYNRVGFKVGFNGTWLTLQSKAFVFARLFDMTVADKVPGDGSQ